MSMILHYILLVVVAAVLFMFLSVAFWTTKGQPEIKSMLEGIIPSLTQAEQLSLEQGFKAIHVKIAPDTKPILYEFHPTNEGALGRKHFSAIGRLTASPDVNDFFFLKKFENDKCYLFTTKFKDRLLGYDIDSWIYRVSAGSKISKPSATTDTITTNLLGVNEGCEPQEECKDMTPDEFTVCRDYYTGILDPFNQKARCADSNDEKLKEQQFTASSTDNCVYDEESCPYIDGKRDCCAFALYESNQHVYKPAYNILCGYEQAGGGWNTEASWYACTGNKQDATISNDRTGSVQFTCRSGEWVVKSGTGIQITNSQLKYTDLTHIGFVPGESETYLEFVVVNNQNEEMKDVKVSAKIADPESSVDCSYLTDTPYADSVEKTTASIAKNGGHFKYSHDNFCWKAKTFDVKVVYKIKEGDVNVDKTKGFKIECPNANPDKEDWQKCAATAALSTGFGGSW